MPGAPASRQVSTASMTLGIVPPRELRSVAILLTLTLQSNHARVNRTASATSSAQACTVA